MSFMYSHTLFLCRDVSLILSHSDTFCHTCVAGVVHPVALSDTHFLPLSVILSVVSGD